MNTGGIAQAHGAKSLASRKAWGCLWQKNQGDRICEAGSLALVQAANQAARLHIDSGADYDMSGD
jgi:hypothetical protein